MSVQEILFNRRSAFRIALILLGVAAYQFLPATQATTSGDITVIRFSWTKAGFITALIAWVGIRSLYSAYRNDTDENRWQLAAFGVILLGPTIYILPGVLLSKVTIDPQGIIFEDYRNWGSKVATLELTNAASLQIRITTVTDKFRVKGPPTLRIFLIAHFTDGTTKSALDFGLLEPYGIDAIYKFSEKLGFTLTDERNQTP